MRRKDRTLPSTEFTEEDRKYISKMRGEIRRFFSERHSSQQSTSSTSAVSQKLKDIRVLKDEVDKKAPSEPASKLLRAEVHVFELESKKRKLEKKAILSHNALEDSLCKIRELEEQIQYRDLMIRDQSKTLRENNIRFKPSGSYVVKVIDLERMKKESKQSVKPKAQRRVGPTTLNRKQKEASHVEDRRLSPYQSTFTKSRIPRLPRVPSGIKEKTLRSFQNVKSSASKRKEDARLLRLAKIHDKTKLLGPSKSRYVISE